MTGLCNIAPVLFLLNTQCAWTCSPRRGCGQNRRPVSVENGHAPVEETVHICAVLLHSGMHCTSPLRTVDTPHARSLNQVVAFAQPPADAYEMFYMGDRTFCSALPETPQAMHLHRCCGCSSSTAAVTSSNDISLATPAWHLSPDSLAHTQVTALLCARFLRDLPCLLCLALYWHVKSCSTAPASAWLADLM